MRSHAILIIGGRLDRQLLDAFFEVGLTAVVKKEWAGASARARQAGYEAVVIDGTDPDTGVLEIMLNVRDFDELVPILVLGAKEPPVRDELLRRLCVQWLSRDGAPGAIARHVRDVTDGAATRGGPVEV